MLCSEPLSVTIENCVIPPKIFWHPHPLGDKKGVAPYGGAFFKFDILSNFSHSCLFHNASFESVFVLEEIMLSNPS